MKERQNKWLHGVGVGVGFGFGQTDKYHSAMLQLSFNRKEKAANIL